VHVRQHLGSLFSDPSSDPPLTNALPRAVEIHQKGGGSEALGKGKPHRSSAEMPGKCSGNQVKSFRKCGRIGAEMPQRVEESGTRAGRANRRSHSKVTLNLRKMIEFLWIMVYIYRSYPIFESSLSLMSPKSVDVESADPSAVGRHGTLMGRGRLKRV
jgi:hypothetical protein